jgi:hypothetical protein
VLHLTDEMVVVYQHYLLVGEYPRSRPFKMLTTPTCRPVDVGASLTAGNRR